MYSTFYKVKIKGEMEHKVYTTKTHTPHHHYLCSAMQGKTYEHDENAKTYFTLGIALDKPVGKYVREVK